MKGESRISPHRNRDSDTASAPIRHAEPLRSSPLRIGILGETPFSLDVDDALATAELIDAAYAAAGLPPRPRTVV
jgi:hypothetical protein